MFARLRESFSHTPRTLRLVRESSPRGTIALGALTLANAGVPLAVAYAGKRITDGVVAKNSEATIRWVLIELGLVAVMTLALRSLSLVRQLVGARLGIDINVMILEKARKLELRHFEDPAFYDQLTRARREASSRPLSVVSQTFQITQNIISLTGYVLLLVRASGWAALGLLAAAIPATIAEMRFSSAAFRLRNWRSPETRKLVYLEYVLANDDHAKEVKLFGLGPLLLDRYKALSELFYGDDQKLAVKRAGWGYGLSLVATAAFYACYAGLAIAAVESRISVGDLVLGVVALRQGQQAFGSILSGIGGMYEDNLYMSNLFSYLAIETDEAPIAEVPALQVTADASPVFDGIEFEDVGFKYPGREEFALRHVSLKIPKGQSVALVGQNGAGKTTLVKLLARLYEPSEGRILIDGKDTRSWDPDALRARLAVVFQDYNRYRFTARENVGFGSVDHRDDAPRLERAVDKGGARSVVSALPKGLDTMLGRQFDSGVELSGGQWQKIALARAFLREEADILVLDEPTAALDAASEHAVFDRFRTLAAGRTTLLISHRFATVRMADRIVVLDGGGVVEDGSHQELVALGGVYAGLFALQAKGYVEPAGAIVASAEGTKVTQAAE
jgi:ATP-binding cassette subfamily B protein